MFNLDLKINLSNHLVNKLGYIICLRGLNEQTETIVKLITFNYGFPITFLKAIFQNDQTSLATLKANQGNM